MKPEMDQVRALFLQISSQPRDQWNALLNQLEPQQQQFRAQLEALLQASVQPDSLLDQTSLLEGSGSEVDAGRLATRDQSGDGSHRPAGQYSTTYDMRDVRPDVVINGRYRLVEKIGEGGMGEVWVARQSEPVKRSVAIKLIKSGMDSKAVLARFEAERQALAIMDHPNIAKVLDGGLMPGGQPYFVMELVKGLPITEFCDRMKLTPEKRLQLFIPVCQAIQHAHQKGIIHRDIKPSNVLVAQFDDVPVPKVIDFGIAKATGGGLSEQTVVTVFGGIVGTPQYMSPEQAMLNNLDIDTRSDVYSLGVLLYELLAGAPPFSQEDLQKAGVLEVLRIVREEEPPRPSAKLSSSQLIATLSANRSSEPERLTKLLRSELDWIVLKALEKERSKRYETAQSFAADIQRYLAGDQVLAHPPTFGYHFRKLAYRNRGVLTALCAVLLALLFGLAGTTWQMLRANREASRAMLEAENARQAKAAAEDALIAGLIRPLGSGDLADGSVARTAIDEIARLKSAELRLRILDQAIRSPQIADRLPTQMSWILQACVGLDLPLHKTAADKSLEIFRDASLDHRVRYAALSCLNELDEIGAIEFDELVRYLNEAPNERKAGVWESLVWVNLRDNRKRMIEFLFEALKGGHGETIATFAATDLQKLMVQDAAFAHEIIERLDSPGWRELWMTVASSTQPRSAAPNLSVSADGQPIVVPGAPLSALQSLQRLRLHAIERAYATDPHAKLQGYFRVADLARNIGATISPLLLEAEGWFSTPEDKWGATSDFWDCLAEANDEAFKVGVPIAIQCISDSPGELEWFLYQNADSLYKIAQRLTPEQALLCTELLERDISSLSINYGDSSRGEAIIGVALGELGRRLSAEVAQQKHQKFVDRLKVDRRLGTLSNSLQAMAAFASVPGYADPNASARLILDNLPKVSTNYVRNACWRFIGEKAASLEPDLLSLSATLVQYDLNNQIVDDSYNDPQLLLDVLLKLRDAGCQFDLDDCLTLILDDYVFAPKLTDEQVAFCRTALSLMKPASRQDLARKVIQATSETDDTTDRLPCSPFDVTLLRELTHEEQAAAVDKALAYWKSTIKSDDVWESSSQESGTAIASLIRTWPEAERFPPIDAAIDHLSSQTLLNSGDGATKPPVTAGLLSFLCDLLDVMREEQRTKFLALVSINGYWETSLSSGMRDKLLDALSPVHLQQSWASLQKLEFDKAASEHLASVGAIRLLKDRERFVKDLSELIEELDAAEFLILAQTLPQFKLKLSREEFRPIAEAANRALKEEPVRIEFVGLADDPKLLAALLGRVDCVTDLQAAVLSRLEQLAFAPQPSVGEAANEFWNSEVYQPVPAPAPAASRQHFRSLRDFLMWNQAKPEGERWLVASSLQGDARDSSR